MYTMDGKAFYDDEKPALDMRRDVCGIREEEERCGGDETSSQFGSSPSLVFNDHHPDIPPPRILVAVLVLFF